MVSKQTAASREVSLPPSGCTVQHGQQEALTSAVMNEQVTGIFEPSPACASVLDLGGLGQGSLGPCPIPVIQ